MPTYGYQCVECQHEFSVFQAMKDDPIKICPNCQGAVKRLMYPVGIVFKGSGWYVNDSRPADKSEKADSDAAKPAETASGDAAKTETPKTETAATSEKSDGPAKTDKPAKAESKPETAAKS